MDTSKDYWETNILWFLNRKQMWLYLLTHHKVLWTHIFASILYIFIYEYYFLKSWERSK